MGGDHQQEGLLVGEEHLGKEGDCLVEDEELVQQVKRHPSWCSPGYTMGSTMAPPLGRTIAPAMLSPPLTGFQTKWSQNSKYVNAPSVRIEYYTLFNSPSQPFDNTSLLSQ